MRLNKQQREKLLHLVHECNEPKSRLLSLLRDIEELSQTKAKGLGSAIARLESWQNKMFK